jgi:hypothetical protein
LMNCEEPHQNQEKLFSFVKFEIENIIKKTFINLQS